MISATQTWLGPPSTEVAFHQISRAKRYRVTDGGLLPVVATSHGTRKSLIAHQALNGATSNRHPISGQRPPYFSSAVDPIVRPMNISDQFTQLFVAQAARRRASGLAGVVRARGDLQCLTDRLDPETTPARINELRYQGRRGSSSRAKKLDAANEISFDRCSCFSCFSSSRIRVVSSVVVPGR